MRAFLIPLTLLAATSFAAELKPETVREFEAYIKVADAQMQNIGPTATRFPKLAETGPAIRSWNKSVTHDVSHGIIHDWNGAIFIEGATAKSVIAALRDIPAYPSIYAPDVVHARRISSANGEDRSFLRLKKKKILTVTLDTEYQTRLEKLGDTRYKVWVRSTRVSEVQDAGEPDEKILPPGTGNGFLWAINSYWLIEQVEGGTFAELRSISLTRNVPLGLGKLVEPMITALPKETVTSTLQKTAAAARARS